MQDSYEAFRHAFVGCVALTVGLVTYAIAAAPRRAPSRLGMRGLKRRRAIENTPLWGQLEPIARWIGIRLSGVIGEGLRRAFDTQLQLAGDYLGLTAEEAVGLSLMGLFAGAGVGFMARPLFDFGNMLLVVFAVVGLFTPYFLITSEADTRLQQLGRGLPYAIDLMALGMSAGLDFPAAILQIVEKSSDPEDAIIEELTRVVQELQLGRTRKQALLDLASRAPLDAVTEFVSALVQAEDRGNPVADVLLVQAASSRSKRSIKAEESAARAGTAMIGPLFLLFACIMLLVMGPLVLKIASAS